MGKGEWTEWEIYARRRYEALRTKYDAPYLPNVWNKVSVKRDEGPGNKARGGG